MFRGFVGTSQKMNKTVWVVWDPLCEKVISAHRTEDGADDRCRKLNEEITPHCPNGRTESNGSFWYTNDEFELED